ncbi:MAG: DUF4185 domain-containing protein [Cyclobacteriaceae bacterium]
MFSIGKVAINVLAFIFLTLISSKGLAQNSKPIVDIRFDADYLQIPSSIGDEWAPTWGADGALYTGNDDGKSFGGIGNRNIAFGKLVGDNPYHLKGTTINEMKDYGFAGEKGPDSASWKTMNSYSVDGVLYMFVTRCLYPEQSGDPKKRHIFRSSSIIKSTDKGVTWTRSESENYDNAMFPGLRFGAPYFVWYGKDGEASVDNADKYVYAVSNNGHFEDGDNYIIGRVPRSRLVDLNARDWQFFAGGDGMQDKNWISDMNKSKPVLQDSMNCSMTGMTYIKGMKRYVMVVWHYTTYDLRKDPRTINEYYEAPKPWGPWTKFKTVDTENLGWYVPIIGQKFQTVVNANTVQCFLYPTGYYINPCLYKLNYIPVTLSTVPLSE